MAKYKGKTTIVEKPVEELYSRFADLNALRETVEKNPKLASFDGQVKFDTDSLTIVNPQVGEIRFEVVERVEPTRVAFKATKSPLPIEMAIKLNPLDENRTEVSTDIDIELPMVLKALIGPKMQKVADGFGSMMTGFTD